MIFLFSPFFSRRGVMAGVFRKQPRVNRGRNKTTNNECKSINATGTVHRKKRRPLSSQPPDRARSAMSLRAENRHNLRLEKGARRDQAGMRR